MKSAGIIIGVVATLLIMWFVDFFTLFLVIVLCAYYRYLKLQNQKSKLQGVSLSIYKYIETIAKYGLLAIDGLINLFFK